MGGKHGLQVVKVNSNGDVLAAQIPKDMWDIIWGLTKILKERSQWEFEINVYIAPVSINVNINSFILKSWWNWEMF